MTESSLPQESIFLQALELTGAERAAYLDGVCGDNRELRDEVEALLRANRQAGDLLDLPEQDGTWADPRTEHPGNRIGPYKLLQLIGEGGMGTVWMAEQTHPVQRKVALKVVKPGMDSKQVLARFEAERQALALMDHPNIAQVFDGGTTDGGRPYFVMELVKGHPITQYCDEHKLTPRERLRLFIPVCQAVQHAHQKGIIHRDLKPGNVLVAPYDGRPVPKIIDFGVAKATGHRLTARTLFTEFGSVVGTLEYMSPEQAELNNQDVDTRSDIYSLGVLLYELLTGTTPLDRVWLKQAAFTELLRMIREEEPPRPSLRLSTTYELPSIAANRGLEPMKLSRLVRGEVDWIVMKCLEKDRNRRYETANSLALDIERYLRDEPVQACPPSALYRFGKFARRHRAALTAVGAVLLALVLGTIVSISQAIRATGAEGLAEQRLTAKEHERERAVQAERAARHQLFEATLAQARASRRSRQVGQRIQSWDALTEAARLARELELGEDRWAELRDEAIACLALTDVRRLKKWKGWPPGSTAAQAFDANLDHYARSDHQGNISVRRVNDDGVARTLPGDGPGGTASGAANMRFSPDSTLLAVRTFHVLPGKSSNFRLWDWRGDRIVFTAASPVTGDALDFSPDGKRLALGLEDGTVALHDTANGTEVKKLKVGFPASDLAFDPDGRRLAVASSSSGELQIHDLVSGTVRKFSAPSVPSAVAWHPQGVVLAAGCADYNAYLFDATTGRQFAVVQGHQGTVVRVAFSPDGGTLLTDGWDGTCRLWDLWTRLELLRVPGGPCAWSQDGRRLASRTGYDLVVWEMVPGREYRTLPRSPTAGKEKLRGGGVSPDGHWLAVGTDAGVRVWDLSAWTEIGLLPLKTTADARFHFREAELFTSGPWGLCRWPVHAQADALRIGPPRKLPGSGWLGRISLDQQGRILAVAGSHGSQLIDLHHRTPKAVHLPHRNALHVATSPDGRWVASGTMHGFGVKVWPTADPARVRVLIPEERITTVAFSSDSRRLVTPAETEVVLWDVDGWQPIHRIPREHGAELAAVAAPNDPVLAVTLSHTVVALIDPDSGRVLARLEAPDADLVSPLGFSPDGSQLVVSTRSGSLRLWDLRLIRARLGELGLDRDLPAYPPPHPVDGKPVKLVADLGDFGRWAQAQAHFARGRDHAGANRWTDAAAAASAAIELEPGHALAWHDRGFAHFRLGQWQKALPDLSKAVELVEDEPGLLNNLAWVLATCPEACRRDAGRAVRLAGRAVEQAPEERAFWNTLGVAHYRAGDPKAAIEALERSRGLSQGGDSYDFFFLALAHARLGQTDRARHWYDEAVDWMDRHRPDDEQLCRFRAEAAELLGRIEQKP